MSDPMLKIKVFASSPCDVSYERQQLGKVFEKLNRTLGREKNIHLELVTWETHTQPSMGRPQGVINKQIGTYDIFIGIMWKRFGTPTGKAESGTEEEFQLAYEGWKNNNHP